MSPLVQCHRISKIINTRLHTAATQLAATAIICAISNSLTPSHIPGPAGVLWFLALVPLQRPWYTGRERGDFVTKPNFEDFQDFLEVHQKELFQQLQRMDVLQVDSPLTQEGLSLLLQTVQDNAVRYTQGYTQLSLYAYHTWLMEQLGLEDQGPA